MSFIVSQDGTHAVKSELIEEIYLDPEEEDILLDEDVDCITVEVALSGSDFSVTMATFDSDDMDENYKAAKKYLAELVKKLNGGNAK
ncbi:MAG: hypothetical protein IJQ85_07450 [Selenomonadaceae bacterium]|nr:hypothetical protein [Selenomonadaceae bacterium]